MLFGAGSLWFVKAGPWDFNAIIMKCKCPWGSSAFPVFTVCLERQMGVSLNAKASVHSTFVHEFVKHFTILSSVVPIWRKSEEMGRQFCPGRSWSCSPARWGMWSAKLYRERR